MFSDVKVRRPPTHPTGRSSVFRIIYRFHGAPCDVPVNAGKRYILFCGRHITPHLLRVSHYTEDTLMLVGSHLHLIFTPLAKVVVQGKYDQW